VPVHVALVGEGEHAVVRNGHTSSPVGSEKGDRAPSLVAEARRVPRHVLAEAVAGGEDRRPQLLDAVLEGVLQRRHEPVDVR